LTAGPSSPLGLLDRWAFLTAGRSPISSSQRFTFGNSSMSIFRVAQLDAHG